MAESNSNIIGWIAAVIVAILIWGNLSKKSKSHPLNSVNVNSQFPLASHEPTAGDSFNSGNSFVPGVSEPVHEVETPSQQTVPPTHTIFPVDPPPIAIQTPVARPIPAPISHPISPVIPAPAPVIPIFHPAPVFNPPVTIPKPITPRVPIYRAPIVYRAPIAVTNTSQKKTGPMRVFTL